MTAFLWHGDEPGVLLVLLADIGQPAEDEHSHDDHQHQQTQLLVAEQRKRGNGVNFEGTVKT